MIHEHRCTTRKMIGRVIAGSLTDGLVVRIDPSTNLADVKAGKFVSVKSGTSTFLSLITDVKLEVSNPEIIRIPPGPHEVLLADVLGYNDMYATAMVRAMVVLEGGKQEPVKSIPPHFSPVYEADANEMEIIFGNERDTTRKYYTIGHPLDMDVPVCIDLEKFVERSNGVFGKTGTGKTFLTRLLLAGLINNDKAVTLIFDMHGEYGLQARQEGANPTFVKGLKTLFPEKMAIFSLDPRSTRLRGVSADAEIIIPYQAIHVDDIISLEHELNLHPTALEAAYLVRAQYKHNWLAVLLRQSQSIRDFAQSIGAHPESLAALSRKLKRIEDLPFFVDDPDTKFHGADTTIGRMLEFIERGTSIIIEFGNFTSTFCYLLIANIITRRLHAEYIKKTEKFLGSHRVAHEPKKLVITIEEAHKFLNVSAARQTIFGTIAREMRKYYVSLLIIDQRPSCIDPEILSQIGTKIIAQLSDERDVQAVLAGAPNVYNLRTILASLDTKRQALFMGHALAMPVVVRTRDYDEAFYRSMNSSAMVNAGTVGARELIEELF